MPLAINQFIYIPPHEWEKHKRLAALLREAYPEMALPARCAQCQCQHQCQSQSTKTTEPTRMTEKSAPAAAALLKQRAAQIHRATNTNTNTSTRASTTTTTTAKNTTITYHGIGKSRWISLGHGFWYSAGPTVAAPWRQWTWLDVVKQTLRWMLVCCIAYAVLCAVQVKVKVKWVK